MSKQDELKFCIIIPVYNHAKYLDNTLSNLAKYNIFTYIVDDGSTPEEKNLIQSLVHKYKNTELISFYLNQGKGAALAQAFKRAYDCSFTHAIQIDADGQHDFNDIEKFIDLSQQHKNALISGLPIYDESIPKSRLYGRYITHFWVFVETLSLSLKDSMCGFRSYPLKETVALITKRDICRRMDFDTDIMVRLYWEGVPSYFIKTKVIYPKDSYSNFDFVKDNIRISIMHTKLCIYMLLHLYPILKKKMNGSNL